jgi:hypothetical protein
MDETPTSEQKRDEFPESYRWKLADQFRERAEKSADILRGLLFALSAGSIAFLANQNFKSFVFLQFVSIGLLIASLAVLIIGWDLQKGKAIRRHLKLREEGFDAYLEYESKIKGAKWFWNQTLDRISMILIALGCPACGDCQNREHS